jgi:DNA modification methylase
MGTTTVETAHAQLSEFSSAQNNIIDADRVGHDWYRFVLSFPPHLVRRYVEKFGLLPGAVVLDPFCGTGTTILECKKLGINAVGIEAHPMAYFASVVKLDWSPDPQALLEHATSVRDLTQRRLRQDGVTDEPSPSSAMRALRQLPPEINRLLLTDSMSPLPLHKALTLLDSIKQLNDDRFSGHERLAFAKSVVADGSNLRFGPEVGLGNVKSDAAIVEPWYEQIRIIASDLTVMRELHGSHTEVFRADSRDLKIVPRRVKVSGVITSPPYPNEKDYTRTTRLETILLGFVHDKSSLRELKKTLIRSNTRGVYKPDDDDRWIASHPEINRIAKQIEARRIELNKDSGFERLYARVTKLYFGGMARHFAAMRRLLAPGAMLAYVVGDQASYLRILIKTGQLLGDLAESLGYEIQSLDLFRTRLATATREQLREEVLVLKWPGKPKKQA